MTTVFSRRRALSAAAAATLSAPLFLLAGGGAQAETSSTTALSALRQATVNRANSAVTTPWTFAVGSTRYTSTLVSSTVNRLEHNGSNDNKNVFNAYNGDAWCGYFAAYTYTGKFVPDASAYPRVPQAYPSSQAWKTVSGFTSWASSKSLPKPGDVVVWQDSTTSASGHVGVVVGVNTTTKKITTVEGNVAGDEINKLTYTYDATRGFVKGTKIYRGYLPREN